MTLLELQNSGADIAIPPDVSHDYAIVKAWAVYSIGPYKDLICRSFTKERAEKIAQVLRENCDEHQYTFEVAEDGYSAVGVNRLN